MTFYVVMEMQDIAGGPVIGVYSTRDLAEAAGREWEKTTGSTMGFDISEHVIDAPPDCS